MPSPEQILATIDAARRVLEADARIAYALVFGSTAREDGRPARDLDLAVGLTRGTRLSVRDLGDLLSRLEKAAGQPVDLVLMQEAPPGLAYRVFAESDLDLAFCEEAEAVLGRRVDVVTEDGLSP